MIFVRSLGVSVILVGVTARVVSAQDRNGTITTRGFRGDGEDAVHEVTAGGENRTVKIPPREKTPS